jgi:hypothetical protein
MVDHYNKDFVEWYKHWDAWHKWASQEPSPWRPIKYIKWLRSEPKGKTVTMGLIPICDIYIPIEKGKKK